MHIYLVRKPDQDMILVFNPWPAGNLCVYSVVQYERVETMSMEYDSKQYLS